MKLLDNDAKKHLETVKNPKQKYTNVTPGYIRKLWAKFAIQSLSNTSVSSF